jgi:hypothetical protein
MRALFSLGTYSAMPQSAHSMFPTPILVSVEHAIHSSETCFDCQTLCGMYAAIFFPDYVIDVTWSYSAHRFAFLLSHRPQHVTFC